MHTCHSTFSLSGHILHRVDFDAATFSDDDLRWLPDPPNFSRAVVKRKAEHLAGRLAAFYALQAHGIEHIAGTGDRRQPLWPDGWYGSISHCGNSALAAVSVRPIGLDIERIMSSSLAAELESSIINSEEKMLLGASGLQPALALTLAFSAKESAFKASLPDIQAGVNFSDFSLVHINEESVKLRLCATEYQLQWIKAGENVITLCAS